jgi:NodT family efflux transporter outer membrane factor (OMF) lipoprotein
MKSALPVLFASLMLASCVSAPPTTPSQVALKSESLGLSAQNAPPVAADWWKDFHDPKLDALVDASLAQNPTLAAALARLRVAQSGLAATEAGTYPQVTFDAQDQRQLFSKHYIIPPPYGGTWQWLGTAQANLSWDLDLWGRQAAMVDQARSSAEATGLDADGARLALSGAIVQAYVNLSRADALVGIAQLTLDDRNHVFALTKAQFNSGIENNAAVKQAEALAAQASQDLTRARAARELLVHDIAALEGRGADAYPDIEASVPAETALALPATLPADLLARRPDILAAQARIDAAVSGRKVARTAFYPDVNLLAFAGFQAIGLSTLFNSSSLGYGAGPAIHLPIFDAGKIRAQYAGATAALDEAVADYNATVVNAVHQTADALTQVQSLERQRADEERSLAAAETSYRLAETRYRSGLSDILVLLRAEDSLLAARVDKANLDADTVSSRITLVIAIGGGFAPDQQVAADAPSHQDKTP